MLLTTERPGHQHVDAEIYHPLSAEDRAAVAAMRAQIEPFKGTMTGPEAREAYDGIMEQTPDAPGVAYETGVVGGVPGIWCRPRTARRCGECRADARLSRSRMRLLRSLGRYCAQGWLSGGRREPRGHGCRQGAI